MCQLYFILGVIIPEVKTNGAVYFPNKHGGMRKCAGSSQCSVNRWKTVSSM